MCGFVGDDVLGVPKGSLRGSEATVRLPPHIMPTRKAFRVQKVGGLRRKAVEESACMKLRTNSPLRTNSIFPFRGTMHFFLCTKEKSAKKEVCEPAVRSPRRAGYRLGKFRPHLKQGFSVQMGCHRGIAGAPNHRFFPAEYVQQNLISFTRTAPRAPYGHRRGLCVGASVRK